MEKYKVKLVPRMAAAVIILLIASSLASAKTVYVADISGNIDAGTYQYVKRVLDTAKAENADYVILRIDTRGGFIKPVRGINEEIINSRDQVGVVSYASKKFTGAFSAGAYVLVASGTAAVDPQAYVGSAQPLIKDEKIISSMADYMGGLAEINRRNISAVRFLVTNNTVLDGKTAKSRGVVEYAPESMSELLDDLNVSGADIRSQNPSFDEALMSGLSNPQIISLLFLAGCLVTVYIIRTRNLRLALIPLVAFAIVLWGVANIEFSLLGIGLIILGVCLISVEMTNTRPAVFGIAGGLSIAVGIILSDSEPFFSSSIEITLASLALAEILVIIAVYVANRFGRSALEESRAGTEALIKEKGRVVEELRPNGTIKIHGKLRQAYSFAEEKIEMGATVQVIKIEGKVLSVIREGGPKKTHGHGGHGGGHDDSGAGHDAHGGGHDAHAGGHVNAGKEEENHPASHASSPEPKKERSTSVHDTGAAQAAASGAGHGEHAEPAAATTAPGKKKLHVNSLLRPNTDESNILHDHKSHSPSEHDDQSHHFTAGPDKNYLEHDHHSHPGPDEAHAAEKEGSQAAKKGSKGSESAH